MEFVKCGELKLTRHFGEDATSAGIAFLDIVEEFMIFYFISESKLFKRSPSFENLVLSNVLVNLVTVYKQQFPSST